MARPRALSGAEGAKEPHSISLKVLRLSRPSLSYQYPLPREENGIPVKASLSYPSDTSDSQFILSPNVTLPPAFGSAYVGETFSCSLSANCELPPEGGSRVVKSMRVVAEMQTPSQIVPLSLSSPEDATRPDSLEESRSVQKIVRFDLKEEGNHVLAVSVSYTETQMAQNRASSGGTPAASGRVRTFRKLYQFIAQPCLSVRTKTTELTPQEIEDKSLGPYGKAHCLRYALEAQLENVGDGPIVLGSPTLNTKTPFKSQSLNWDSVLPEGHSSIEPPILGPRDVLQIAFLVEQDQDQLEGSELLQKDMGRDGRTTLGQLSIEWRSAMGDKGFLTTGNLMTKKR